MTELKISNFELSYDGAFKLRFSYNRRVFEIYVYLAPLQLLKLLNAECYTTTESMDVLESAWIPFDRSEIKIGVFLNPDGSVDGFLTSDYTENWQDKGIILFDLEV
jgi:hypothetical protein